ncbi:NDUFA4 mitochondrial complex associated [Phyllostomus discolor]|uniref:Cytochrome c oxidase subunit NDUFA4 n=1 Tax=Phyllostomus discolor TaxID=89673 RepID=A0A834DNA5_9CHIR|nr:NDUFA4 mitochondrial complex associated [Phyllostomus discolor]
MLRQIVGQAKKHPSLIPLFVFIGAGGTGALLYVMRLALFNPDVCWDKKNNPEPWNKLGPNEQYKVSYKVVSECWRVCFNKVCYGLVFFEIRCSGKFHYRNGKFQELLDCSGKFQELLDCSVKLNW